MEKKYLTGLLILIGVIISAIFIWNPGNYKSDAGQEVYEINDSYCNRIHTPDMKKICFAMIEKDFNNCRDMYFFDIECYEKVFMFIENFSESVCENFSGNTPRNICYSRLAELTKNHSFCEKAGSKYQDCSWKLARLMNEPQLCDAIGVDCEKYRCFAEVSGDISYCENVVDSCEQKMCFSKLLNNLTIDSCGEFNPEEGEILYVGNCLHNVAKVENNISICEMITRKEDRWSCIAELSKDREICAQADTRFWRDYCLVEVLKNKLIEKSDFIG